MVPSSPDDPLIPVPIPSLVALLLRREQVKGSPLTEEEVIAIRDGCVCIMMRTSHLPALVERRGYDDIDPERAWEQWQAIRESLHRGDP